MSWLRTTHSQKQVSQLFFQWVKAWLSLGSWWGTMTQGLRSRRLEPECSNLEDLLLRCWRCTDISSDSLGLLRSCSSPCHRRILYPIWTVDFETCSAAECSVRALVHNIALESPQRFPSSLSIGDISARICIILLCLVFTCRIITGQRNSVGHHKVDEKE